MLQIPGEQLFNNFSDSKREVYGFERRSVGDTDGTSIRVASCDASPLGLT